jgi:hypothetical protein
LKRPLWRQSSTTTVAAADDSSIIARRSDAFTAVERSRSVRLSWVHRNSSPLWSSTPWPL